MKKKNQKYKKELQSLKAKIKDGGSKCWVIF